MIVSIRNNLFKNIVIALINFEFFCAIAFGQSYQDAIASCQKKTKARADMCYEMLYTCPLVSNDQMDLILKEHSPTEDSVIIDIGSGLGGCSRYLAVLGYTIYSIDFTPEILQTQKNNFCNFPISEALTELPTPKNNPPMLLGKDALITRCQNALKRRVHFIEGDFSDEKVINLITNIHPKWNVVIALDSLQFFNDSKRQATLNIIDKHLVSNGVFIASTFPKSNYGNKSSTLFGGVYEFDLEQLLHNSILTKYTTISTIDNKNYKSLLTRGKWLNKFLRLVALTKENNANLIEGNT